MDNPTDKIEAAIKAAIGGAATAASTAISAAARVFAENAASPTAKQVFAGKSALVVGGSGGIGRYIAVELGRLGANLTVHGGSSQERMDRTLAEIRVTGAKAQGILCNPHACGISMAEFSKKLLECSAAFGPPDILVCAWGLFKRLTVENTCPDDWQTLVSSNLILPGTLVSACLPSMTAQKWGRILLFGGTNRSTIRGFYTSAAYSAAKTALGSLAKSVAKSAGASGVACNVICPGLTDTEYRDTNSSAYNTLLSPGGSQIAAHEIAAAAWAILTAPRLNGAIIPVDDGLELCDSSKAQRERGINTFR